MKRRLKSWLDSAGLLPIARRLLPKYRRPMARIVLARLRGRRRELAEAYSELSRAQLSWECPEDALQSCADALTADPLCASAFNSRADVKAFRGNLADAALDYRKAVELGLEPPAAKARACMAIGRELFKRLEDPRSVPETLKFYEAALSCDPEEPDYYITAGQAFLYSGDFAKAEEIWAKSGEIRDQLARSRGLDRRGVRFIGPSWSSFHLAVLDFYFKMQELGMRPPQRTLVAVGPGRTAPTKTNEALVRIWEPRLEVVADVSAAGLSEDDAKLLQDDMWTVTMPDGRSKWFLPAAFEVEQRWEAEGRPPLLRLSDEDKRKVRDVLRELGMPDDAWFVCLHVREAGYWKGIDEEQRNPRNADISTYFDAVREITSRGGWVVRIGDRAMKRLPPMERVIDFAHSELRTEWMDIFLLAGCRFFIGTASGPASVPPIYGVPCGLTNWVPIGHPLWYREVVWIPKLVRSRDKGRVLTLAEIYEAGIGRQQYARHLDERGLNAVDNSADDIAALALEMLERCEGRCAYREEDETLQRSFARISNSHGGYFGGRVGRDFLRNHPELLENSAALTP